MRWNFNKEIKWEKWFAWYPVKIEHNETDAGTWVWMDAPESYYKKKRK